MPVSKVIIMGAGPCGMSAAIALSKISTPDDPIHVTILEVRSELGTIGGTLNMTPLAMRYLDYLGVGQRLRQDSIDLKDGLDCVSLRTGQRIGNIWANIGGIRTIRHKLVQNLLRTIQEDHSDKIEIKWGIKVSEIRELGDHIELILMDGTSLQGDVLLGCDGINSAARRLLVEPQREKKFTGRVIAMGFEESGKIPPMRLSNGEEALRDTAVITSQNGMLLVSKFEPSRQKTYFAHTMFMDEPRGDSREGWKLLGEDKDAVRKEVVSCFDTGRVRGVQEVVAKCHDWHLWPVYILPLEGRWHHGRVLLMGDAAHAMPPQGESTGLAIEDGVLLAHVFQARRTRSIEQLLSDFETVRKPIMDKYHKSAVWAMEHGFHRTSWFKLIIVEWGIWLYLLLKRWTQQNHFAGDVRKLQLPI